MAIDTERIFLLATKKSQRVENLTYCIGVPIRNSKHGVHSRRNRQ